MQPVLLKKAIGKTLSKIDQLLAKSNDLEKDLAINELLMEMDRTQFLFPFNWVKEFDGGHDPRLNEPKFIAEAGIELLRKIMVTHVRLDRYCCNHLYRFITSPAGKIWIKRLKEIYLNM